MWVEEDVVYSLLDIFGITFSRIYYRDLKLY